MAPLLRLRVRGDGGDGGDGGGGGGGSSSSGGGGSGGGSGGGGSGGGGAIVDPHAQAHAQAHAHGDAHAHRGTDLCLEDGTPLPTPLWPWLRQQQTPVLMPQVAAKWPLRRWTIAALEHDPATAALPVQVRWHRVPTTTAGSLSDESRVVLEGDGWFEATTLDAACRAARDPRRRPAAAEGPGTDGGDGDAWTAYVSYHHLHDLLGGLPDRLAELAWAGTFGVAPEPEQCAFWLGSPGAHTPCHLDTYGCNIAVQLDGRKRWTLFPPTATADLRPTRVPYEESTIFSRRADLPGDLDHVVVTLERTPALLTPPWSARGGRPDDQRPSARALASAPPDPGGPRGWTAGDALFVPHHWWHRVECLEPAVSVNHWLALPEDAAARVHEAVVRHVVGAFVRGGTASPAAAAAAWLNPGEAVADNPDEEVELLRGVLGDPPTELVQPALLRALTHPDVVARVVDLLRADLGGAAPPCAKRARVA